MYIKGKHTLAQSLVGYQQFTAAIITSDFLQKRERIILGYNINQLTPHFNNLAFDKPTKSVLSANKSL